MDNLNQLEQQEEVKKEPEISQEALFCARQDLLIDRLQRMAETLLKNEKKEFEECE